MLVVLTPNPGGPPPGPSKGLNSVAFSPDGKYLLLGYGVFRGEGFSRRDVSYPYLDVSFR